MRLAQRPHLLGIDDAPFTRGCARPVPLVAAMMEGSGPLEAVALGEFPEDGDDATGYLGGWIATMRCREALHGVIVGGITLAGLGLIDVPELARRLELPVIVFNRRCPRVGPLVAALRAAGLGERESIVRDTPRAVRAADGAWVAQSGATDEWAVAMALAVRGKARVPEPLRVAHLIAAALVRGESRGRV